VFKSEAVGFKGPYFLNLAASYQSDLGIEDVLSELHRIEDRLGRERSKDEMSSRTIDLDLLLYGDGIFYDDGFDVPRKEILDSAHVLKPLSDILPHMVHPVIGETLGTLWDKTPAPKKALLTEAPLTL
jgi:2-amino-4-hydroxy-6-hydroxymethyldihydropteridine diphosphokinase